MYQASSGGVCVCVCMCVCMCACTSVQTCTYIRISVCTTILSLYIHTCMRTCLHTLPQELPDKTLMIATGTVNERGSVHPTRLRPLECRTADHQGCSGGVAEVDLTSQVVTTGGNSPVRFAPDQLTLLFSSLVCELWGTVG